MIHLAHRDSNAPWEEHEILWVLAAMELPRHDQFYAFQDIADLTHRTFHSVFRQANNQRDLQRYKAVVSHDRDRFGFKWKRPKPKATLPPSTLNTGAKMEAMRRGAKA